MMFSDRRDLFVTRFNCIHLHFVFILPEMDSESSTLVSWKTNERNSHREWCILTEEICLALNTTAFIFISSSSCQKWTQNHRHWFLGKPMKEILIENDVFWQKRSVRTLDSTAFIFISSSSCQKWTQNHRHWFLGKPMKEILIENDVFWQKRSVRN